MASWRSTAAPSQQATAAGTPSQLTNFNLFTIDEGGLQPLSSTANSDSIKIGQGPPISSNSFQALTAENLRGLTTIGQDSRSSRPTNYSYYSASGMSSPNPLRYAPAAEFRKQLQNAPNQDKKPARSRRYPKEHHNHRGLPLEHPPLSQGQTRLEFPFLASANYPGYGPPGPARVAYNDGDRTSGSMVYHDLRKPIKKCQQRGGCGARVTCIGTGKCRGPVTYDFSLANYRSNPSSPCAQPDGCGSPGNCATQRQTGFTCTSRQ